MKNARRRTQARGTAAAAAAVASPSPQSQPQPTFEQATVRHIVGVLRWILSTDNDTRAVKGHVSLFQTGLMTGVRFNAKAPVIEDLWCGSGNKSEASASGLLWKVGDLDDLSPSSAWPKMPEDVVRVDDVGYNKDEKFFFGKSDPENPLTSADYLFLASDGTAKVGWKASAAA